MTLECTTQNNIRSAIIPLSRRYRTDLLSQRLRILDCKIYTDTLFAKEKSISGNKCAQIFTDGSGFVFVYPMKLKSEAGDAMNVMTRDIGVPREVFSDNAFEEIGSNTEFQKCLNRCIIDYRRTEPFSPWKNIAENIIGIIKQKTKRRRINRNIPKRLWDFGMVLEAEIYSRTSGKDGRTSMDRLTGDTNDISEWIEFEFYDLCHYWDNQTDSREPNIGIWLGVVHRVGSALCYWILTNKGNVISRTTVQNLTKVESENPDIKCLIKEYHVSMWKEVGKEEHETDLDGYNDFINDYVPSLDNSDTFEENYSNDLSESPEMDDIVDNSDVKRSIDTYDQYIGA